MENRINVFYAEN